MLFQRFFKAVLYVSILITLFALCGDAYSRPDPGFTNVAKKLGIEEVKAARSQWVDVNNDGWLDLVILDFRPGKDKEDRQHIYENVKKGSRRAFREITEKSGILANRDRKKKGSAPNQTKS